jgi:hypothetical protein
MAIAEIQQWLSSSTDFKKGVALYKAHGNNQALINMFDRLGHTPFTERKLIDALTPLAGEETTKPQAVKVIKKKPAEKLPKDLESIRKSTLDKYKDMAALHQQLCDAQTDEDRKSIADQIISLDAQVAQGFEMVDHYQDTGERLVINEKRVKRGKDVNSMSNAELAQSLKNIPTYLTKLRRRIEKGDIAPDKLYKLQQAIADHESDLKIVKQKLQI